MRLIHVGLVMFAVWVCFGWHPVEAAENDYGIAYLSAAGSGSEIWSMNPDGTDAREMKWDGPPVHNLTVSPDGQYLAFYVQGVSISYTYQYSIGILNLLTGEQQRIKSEKPISILRWSSDSQQLLFQSIITHEKAINTYTINSINRDGSHQTQLSQEFGVDMGISLSPDESTLYLAELRADSGYDISSMDIDGSNRRLLEDFEACFMCKGHQWTPDGLSIVFYMHSDLYIIDADGKNLRQLTDFAEDYDMTDAVNSPFGRPTYTISSDGQSLVYTMGYPMIQLVKMPLGVDGWVQRQVVYESTSNRFRGALLSPDAQSAFVEMDTPQGDWLTRIDTQTGETFPLMLDAINPVIVAAS